MVFFGKALEPQTPSLSVLFSARVVPHTGSDVDEQQLNVHGGKDPAYPGPSWGHHQCQGKLSTIDST